VPDGLPAPIDGVEQYLAAIHDRLGQILDRLPAPPEPADEGAPVELREPAVPAEQAAPQPAPAELTEPAAGTRQPGSAAGRRPSPSARKPAKGRTAK